MPAASKRRVVNFQRPWLYPKQRDAFFCPERYAIVEASTKAGKTTACIVWLLEQAVTRGRDGRNFWWVAPIIKQAKIAYRRMKRAIPAQLFTKNDSELTITLFNGAVIWFKSAHDPDSLYGEDVYGAVIDEGSRCKEESWFALRSTLTATRALIRIIGNVKGRANWHYKLARRAESGEPDMRYTKIICWDAVEAGVLAQEEIEDAQRVLPEDVFNELYLCEPSDDGGNPFGLAAIKRQMLPGLLTDKPARVFGVDLARKRDYVVVIGLDEDGGCCRFERWQADWDQTVSRILGIVGETPTLVDESGVGDMPVQTLEKARYGVFEGYLFSAPSKQRLMEGLAVAIQQGQVWYPDGPIVNELETFEYEYTRTGVRYTAPDGMHDDCVCALALAVQHLATAPPPLAFAFA
jgi:hypothetical protein